VATLWDICRHRHHAAIRRCGSRGEDDLTMGFTVYPPALRVFARHLADAAQDAEAAKRYIDQHGTFSMHDSGLMGLVVPSHRNLLADLDTRLKHLADLADASSRAMHATAAHYEQVDLRAEAATDAAFPPVPRPPVSRD
jgi:hypothetical protein